MISSSRSNSRGGVSYPFPKPLPSVCPQVCCLISYETYAACIVLDLVHISIGLKSEISVIVSVFGQRMRMTAGSSYPCPLTSSLTSCPRFPSPPWPPPGLLARLCAREQRAFCTGCVLMFPHFSLLTAHHLIQIPG